MQNRVSRCFSYAAKRPDRIMAFQKRQKLFIVFRLDQRHVGKGYEKRLVVFCLRDARLCGSELSFPVVRVLHHDHPELRSGLSDEVPAGLEGLFDGKPPVAGDYDQGALLSGPGGMLFEEGEGLHAAVRDHGHAAEGQKHLVVPSHSRGCAGRKHDYSHFRLRTLPKKPFSTIF